MDPGDPSVDPSDDATSAVRCYFDSRRCSKLHVVDEYANSGSAGRKLGLGPFFFVPLPVLTLFDPYSTLLGREIEASVPNC